MNWKFCHLCGGKLNRLSEHSFSCSSCGQRIFQTNTATSDASIINSQNELLVVKRAQEPYKGKYDLPGGFIDIGEKSVEEALLRELNEELGIKSEDIAEMTYLASGASIYPWGNDTTYPFVINFLVRLKEGTSLQPADDVASYEWKPVTDITKDFFSFAAHNNNIIPALLKRLQI